jgi:hypothetical protein
MPYNSSHISIRMWLFTRYGFFSIACASEPDGSPSRETVMVRARQAGHLQNLQNRFQALSGAPITRLTHRDYRYRMIVPIATWTGVLSEVANEQEWSNFKGEVSRYQGRAGSDYVHALHQIWSIMRQIQDREVRGPSEQ